MAAVEVQGGTIQNISYSRNGEKGIREVLKGI